MPAEGRRQFLAVEDLGQGGAGEKAGQVGGLPLPLRFTPGALPLCLLQVGLGALRPPGPADGLAGDLHFPSAGQPADRREVVAQAQGQFHLLSCSSAALHLPVH
jgi:hypothetical protein